MLTTIEELKSTRKEILQVCEKRLDGRNNGRSIVKSFSSSVDDFIISIWQDCAISLTEDVDLIATGGFGRSELCPHSDWDLLILVDDDLSHELKKLLSKFAQMIWDSGANFSHSVRSVKEARAFFEIDHHARTAFLESRLLAGKGRLYSELSRTEAVENWDLYRQKNFCLQKLEESRVRRANFGDTAFCMEPNVKNGKGGLRDVSTIFWLSMVWYRVSAARKLINEKIVSETEFDGFVKARDFLWKVRTALHLESGRENDILSFEYQLRLARRLRYRGTNDSQTAERFLKNYFLKVKTIAELTDIFLLHFEERITPSPSTKSHIIGGCIKISGGVLSVIDEQKFLKNAANLLEVFRLSQIYDVVLNSNTLRLIRLNKNLLNSSSKIKSKLGVLFLSILQSDLHVSRSLQLMHETGVLGRFCLDFQKITGFGQFDRYHHFTVDAHTIRGIAFMNNFDLIEEGKMNLAFLSTLKMSLEKPELLYIAVLYHDIAKGRGGDHSKIGAELAQKFCKKLGLTAYDAELVSWLVLNHLVLSKTAQHFDINDRNIVEEFAVFVGERERLIALFLLTIVDVAAVGPGTLTEWKKHLFFQLFHSTDNLMRTGQMPSSAQGLRIKSRKKAVISLSAPEKSKAIGSVLEILPSSLILNSSPVITLEFCTMLNNYSGVKIFSEEERGFTKILAWGEDRSGLFASLAAGLADLNVKIITANAYTLKDSRVMDVFHITDHNDQALLEKNHLNRIKAQLNKILTNTLDISVENTTNPDILMRALPVSVKQHESAGHNVTAIEVVAADRKGLLATLARALLSEELVLKGVSASTFGEKAVDMFFLVSKNGTRLSTQQTSGVIDRLKAAARID